MSTAPEPIEEGGEGSAAYKVLQIGGMLGWPRAATLSAAGCAPGGKKPELEVMADEMMAAWLDEFRECLAQQRILIRDGVLVSATGPWRLWILKQRHELAAGPN